MAALGCRVSALQIYYSQTSVGLWESWLQSDWRAALLEHLKREQFPFKPRGSPPSFHQTKLLKPTQTQSLYGGFRFRSGDLRKIQERRFPWRMWQSLISDKAYVYHHLIVHPRKTTFPITIERGLQQKSDWQKTCCSCSSHSCAVSQVRIRMHRFTSLPRKIGTED